MSEITSEHAPSLLPAGRQWKLVWHDEFDGTELDRTKWDFRLHLLQTRCEHFVGEEGVYLDGESRLHFKLVRKGDNFYSSQIQTGSNYLDRPGKTFYTDADGETDLHWPIAKFVEPKFLHRYGYYEARCLTQQHAGWWSAFWLQSPTIGCSPDPRRAGVEVDVMECFTPEANEVRHNNHWSGYGEDHQHCGSGPRTVDTKEWHTYGLDWTPERYVYYIDGKESWRVEDPVSQTDAFILFSIECGTYRRNGKPNPLLFDAEGDEFVVDYVRVYDEVSGD